MTKSTNTPSLVKPATDAVYRVGRATSLSTCHQPTDMASPEPVAAEFRILDLQPGAGNDAIVGSLRTARLGDGERYEALSYVWGDSAGAKAVVTVSGQRIAVTASLHAALSRLRSPTVPRALWIDQLCIDQWDPQHKAGQVKLMRHIYRQCVQCVIWFGEIDEPTAGFGRVDAEVAFAFVEALAARTADDGPEVAPAYLAFHGNKRALRAFVAFAPGQPRPPVVEPHLDRPGGRAPARGRAVVGPIAAAV